MKLEQKQQFLLEEGDAYFTRNFPALVNDETLAAADVVLSVLAGIKPFPRCVLETGCANGWRLQRMQALGAESCYGVDPSRSVVECGTRSYPNLQLSVGTADELHFPNASFGLVVFGFCLYLCDPSDHFRIVAEADRVLGDGGYLALFDFDPPFSYRNPYSHRLGVFSYKMDYSRLFLAHPHYQLLAKRTEAHGGSSQLEPDNRVGVSLLYKSTTAAWPDNPWNRAS